MHVGGSSGLCCAKISMTYQVVGLPRSLSFHDSSFFVLCPVEIHGWSQALWFSELNSVPQNYPVFTPRCKDCSETQFWTAIGQSNSPPSDKVVKAPAPSIVQSLLQLVSLCAACPLNFLLSSPCQWTSLDSSNARSCSYLSSRSTTSSCDIKLAS